MMSNLMYNSWDLIMAGFVGFILGIFATMVWAFIGSGPEPGEGEV